MGLFVYFLVGILSAPASGQDGNGYCVADDRKPFASFGTHTPYEAANTNTDPDKDKYQVKDCKPAFLWHLVRHGTRYPGGDDIREMLEILESLKPQVRENYDAGRTSLCQKDMNRIDAWSMEPADRQGYDLTTQGQDDEYQIAYRFRKRFPELLGSGDYNAHLFRYDESVRTQDSAKWYSKGLLGYTPRLRNGLHPLNDFYRRCPSFAALKKSDTYLEEEKKFERSVEMNASIARVSRRLGFSTNLTLDVARSMFEICGFERAWNWRYGKGSPWCAAFQGDDLKVFEYWGDLHEYYRTGHGHDLHVKLGCAAIKEMVTKLKTKIDGTEDKAGIHMFSHDTLINMAISNLGLFKDKLHLRADNFDKLKDRKWRVSKFSPFGSNLAAVLYKCEGNTYRVKLLLGEKALDLDGCDGKACSWDTFMEKYGQKALDNCDLKTLCQHGNKTYPFPPVMGKFSSLPE